MLESFSIFYQLWRRDEDDEFYSINSQGLFPNATANSRYMHDLGLFVEKALQM